MLELLAPWDVNLMGRPLTTGESLSPVDFLAAPGWLELLAPWDVNLMGRPLTTGESLSPVDFLAAPGWLELPAPLAGLPELLDPY
jgi:hypothetical protein